MPWTTLRDRLRGHQFQYETRSTGHKMTQAEEESLIKWILSMDLRGNPPRPKLVQDMANLLLATRHKDPPSSVGKNWVHTFVKRHSNILASRFSRRYDYQRAQNEDPKVIQEWFNRVRQVIIQYGIALEDIYNFDETGFAMGLTATAKVITRSEYYGKRASLQPGNREWVTVIESVSASGRVLSPYIIFKGKVFIQSWFDELPNDWTLNVSPNGWTTDEIGLS